jgi:UDP-N-acetylglucosamine acyltransferase
MVVKPQLNPSGDIHPAAIVHPNARVGRGVTVGPFSVVGPNVELGDGCVIHPHVVVDGHTEIGARVEIFPGASVGMRPQDLKYDGSPTKLLIGADTVVRECVTLQPGTSQTGCGVTRIGERVLIMAYSHVAHDCTIGDRVIIANATQIAGHCVVEEHAILGGATTVHQFVRIGAYAITGAATRVQQDVPPFTMADGHPARLYGLNVVGLRRAGFSSERRLCIKRAYRALFVDGPFREAVDRMKSTAMDSDVDRLLSFVEQSRRGVTRSVRQKRSASAIGSASSDSDERKPD